MAKVIHEIDPDADTVIILKNPLASFAVWGLAKVEGHAEAPDPVLKPISSLPIYRTHVWGTGIEEPDIYDAPAEEPVLYDAPADEPVLYDTPVEETAIYDIPAEEPAIYDVPAEEPALYDVPSEEPALYDAPAEEPAVYDAPAEEPAIDDVAIEDATVDGHVVREADTERSCEPAPIAETTVEPDASEYSIDEEEIHYYVSSQHLRLASPKFKNMLSGGKWREGIPDKTDGRYHIPAEDWDIEALLILLNVLHHRNRQVPRSLSLEMLAKIVVLIDYYECPEATELCTETWVRNLRKTSPPPSDFCRNLILWMCIAWVLKLPQEFTQTTAVAFRRGDRELSTLGLPIIDFVDKIDQTRKQSIGTVVSQLQDLLSEYRNPLYKCPSGSNSFECGSILYGALTKGMDLAGLMAPYPVAPYSGLDVGELYSKLRSIKSPSWCYPNKYKSKTRHPCDLNARVMKIADRVFCFPDGLKLKDFERT